MKIRKSVLDNKTIVFEVESGDEGSIVDYLNKEPNGYAIFGEKVEMPIAVVDGRIRSEEWFTDDHLLAIEAHELGHILTNSEKEDVAEKMGIKLLQTAGFNIAANILPERGVV